MLQYPQFARAGRIRFSEYAAVPVAVQLRVYTAQFTQVIQRYIAPDYIRHLISSRKIKNATKSVLQLVTLHDHRFP